MAQFIGRDDELKILEGLLKKKSASLVVIKGRRRIGKSRLVEEFSRRHAFDAFFRFSGIPPGEATTAQSQMEVFGGQISTQLPAFLGFSENQLQDWTSLFFILAERVKVGKVLIFFDEISWMGSKDPDFLGKLKNAWDIYFKQNDNLILVLCGSYSTWIERNILSNTGYLGRISVVLTLKELSLPDCAKFWGAASKQVSAYEKLKLLAVTGGVPLYLEHIRSDLSAEENITSLCFRSTGLLFREFDQVFSDLFSKRSLLYKKIILALAKGAQTFDQICSAIDHVASSSVEEYLKDLMTSGFIVCDRTWNTKTGALSKLKHYRLIDCYSRFYLKYIDPNREKIDRDQFQTIKVSDLLEWSGLMGLQFESLVLNNRKKIWQALKISPEEIVVDNPFFQRKTLRHQGCQIDYMIQTRFNTVYVCEIKFSKREIGASILEEVEEKIERLCLPKRFSYRPVLIHVNGVSEDVEESGYFAHIFDVGDLLMDL